MTYPYKTSMILYISVLVTVLMLAVYTAWNYYNTIYFSLRNDSDMYLTETASQSVSSVNTKINKDINTLKDISLFLDTCTPSNIGQYLPNLNQISHNSNFKHMTVSFADGTSYATDGTVQDSSKTEFFQNGITGQSGLTSPLTDRDGKQVNVYYVPIISENAVIGVLSATQNTDTFENMIDLTTFDGAGYAYITNNAGVLFAASQNSIADPDGKTLFDLCDSDKSENAVKIQMVIDNMQTGSEGGIEYTFNGQKQYMRYLRLDINGWYLVSVLPQGVINQKTSVIIYYTAAISIFIILLFAGVLIYVVYVLNKNRRKLAEYAYTDSAVNCRNLNAMYRDMEKILRSKTDKHLAVIRFDIDKFKYINDIYGYQAGNDVLLHITNILSELTMENECFCRISNDYFAALLQYDTEDELTDRICNIINNIENLSVYGNRPLDISVSMGVYVITNYQMSINSMLDCAATAHKAVKNNRITKYVFYSEKMRSQLTNEKNIENEMVPALAQKQFEVYYQPKYSIGTNTLQGAEALVRWNHPKRGLISPNEFIPIFEKNGFIANLDLYVFEEVCIHLSNWLKQGKPIVPVSINLSRVHIYEPNFMNKFKIILDKYRLSPSLIEFEITETTALENTRKLIDIIDSIHHAGFRVSMDDFGSGYSSLNMLKELPIDTIKIDREFFIDCENNNRAKEIVLSIVSLAKRLNMEVVAEGIETEGQLALLKEIHCDIAQGYLFARPMRMPEFEKQLLLSEKRGDTVEKKKTL